jgi:hypothetical protein
MPRSGDPESSSFPAKLDYSPHPAAHPCAIGCADVRSGILPPQSGFCHDEIAAAPE